MIPGDPSQMMPSTPMTGPTPAKRKLPMDTPGAGMELTPEAQLEAQNEYIIPARPSTLRRESEEPTLGIQLSRRHLNTGMGPRRL